MGCLFSIVMPVYNAENTIEKSIDSVLMQTYHNFELIICNDGSTDKTLELIKKYSDNRIVLTDNKFGRGVSGARNSCIELATGKYIAFLDSDDLWEPGKLEKQLRFLEQGHLVVCSNYSKFKGDVDNIISYEKRKERFSLFDMLMRCQIGNLTGVYNQEVLGKFYQLNQGHEDYLMWLEVLSKAGHGYCIQENLAYYRVSPSSLSGNKIKAAKWQWRIYRDNLKLGFVKSSFFWINYAIRALLKIG